ncbi:MAG: SOS response-associated peptidase [Acidobacteria bacterium]|nr:MAG: SOS response-associated peptidase [Acidobacteriota bacterium]
MCGRYTLTDPDELVEALDAEVKGELRPRFNVAPTQEAPAVRVRRDTGGRVVMPLRWGLIPFWAKDAAIGNRMINARAETVAEKPAFRTSLRRKRCGVLADGFYEWRKEDGGKQPYFIHLKGRRPFLMAGLWDRWEKGPEGPIDSFTIITTDANERLRELHHRMPVILPEDAWATWLDPELDEAAELIPLLRPCAPGDVDFYPVSRMVNRPQNDVPACVERVRT